jgi:hypothetical protein
MSESPELPPEDGIEPPTDQEEHDTDTVFIDPKVARDDPTVDDEETP